MVCVSHLNVIIIQLNSTNWIIILSSIAMQLFSACFTLCAPLNAYFLPVLRY